MLPSIPRIRTLQSRSFSTSGCLRAIGPESPKWLPVPPQVQPNPAPRKPVKGVLPVPRDPFRRDNKHAYKAGTEYLSAVTPEPKSTSTPEGPEADRLAWKTRMAEARRRNLREGMTELARRKIKRTEFVNAKQQQKHTARQQLLDAPERDDERLTRPTIPPEIRALLSHKGPPEPSHTARQVRKAQLLYKKRQAAKAAERQAQLHILHTHARNFIVNEEALDKAIELEFGSDERPRGFGSDGRGLSVWDDDVPMTVREMVAMTEGKEDIEHMRLRRLAEELTGGRV